MANCIIRTRIYLFAAVSCLAMTAAMVPPASAEDLAVVQLLGTHAGYAVNPETGDIAAIDVEGSSVRLYQAAFFGADKAPPEAKAATGSVKVGGSPSSIIYKKFKNRGVWAVVCKKDPQMHLLDSGTLGLVKKIPLSSGDVTHVYASLNAADPFIYYVHAGGSYNAINARVNLATLTNEGQVFDESSETAISATGRLFYKRRTSVSPTGFECWQKFEGANPNEKPRFDPLFTEHNSTWRYLPDAFEQYTIAGPMGQDVYSADLRKKLGQLSFRPECIFATRPVIAGLNGIEVMVASYNSFETTGKLALPEALVKIPAEGAADEATLVAKARRRARGAEPPKPPPTRLFADDKNGRMVAIVEDRAVAIPLSAFNLPDEPYLVVRAEVPQLLAVGEPARIPLKKIDPRTQVAIGDGPEGVKIEDDSVVWTPNESQVGTSTITLQLSHQDSNRVQTIEVQVNRPVATLPFNIEKFAVSADGKRAVCWGSEAAEPAPPYGEQNAPTKIAVVDLEKLQVTAQTTVPYRVGNGAIDNEFAYVSQLNSGTIQALSIADLQRKKQALNSDQVWSLNIVGDTLFAGMKNSVQLAYQIPDLRRNAARDLGKNATGGLPHHMRGYPGSEPHGSLPWIVQMRDGWHLDDVVYNSGLSKVRLIGKVAGVNTVGYSTPEQQVYVDPQQRPIETAWGKLRPEVALAQFAHQDRLRMLDWLVLVPYPIHVSLVTEQQVDAGGGFRQELTVRLEARDLVSGQIKSQAVLTKLDNPPQPQIPSYSMSRNSLRAVGDLVFAAYKRQLFKYQFPKPPAEDFPVPLHFVPEQSALVLKSGEKNRLTHKLEGGEKPYQVAMVNADTALSVDSETADVQVDGPALVKQAMDQLLTVTSSPNTDGSLARLQQVGAVTFDEHVRNATQAYVRLVGRDPQGIPVPVPVHLRLSDASGQTAELSYFVFAEVPRQEYQAKLEERNKREAEDRKKQEAERKKREEVAIRAREADRAKREDLATGRDVADRVLLLEHRMKAIEDRLELITRLLTDRRNGERPRPADPRGGNSIDTDTKEKTKVEVNDGAFKQEELKE